VGAGERTAIKCSIAGKPAVRDRRSGVLVYVNPPTFTSYILLKITIANLDSPFDADSPTLSAFLAVVKEVAVGDLSDAVIDDDT
jgi:hypothetical protein